MYLLRIVSIEMTSQLRLVGTVPGPQPKSFTKVLNQVPIAHRNAPSFRLGRGGSVSMGGGAGAGQRQRELASRAAAQTLASSAACVRTGTRRRAHHPAPVVLIRKLCSDHFVDPPRTRLFHLFSWDGRMTRKGEGEKRVEVEGIRHPLSPLSPADWSFFSGGVTNESETSRWAPLWKAETEQTPAHQLPFLKPES